MRRVVAAALLMALAGCGGEAAEPPQSAEQPDEAPSVSAAAPQDVVERLLRALDAGDCAAAKRVVVTPSVLDCGQVDETAGTITAAGVDLDDMRYRAERVVADSTTVEVTTAEGESQGSYDLQRVDGTWRVVFDSAA